MGRAPERTLGLVEEVLDLIGIRDVGFDGDGARRGGWIGAGRAELGGDSVGFGRAGGVVDDEQSAEGAEVRGDRAADAAGSAGDDGDAAVEG